MASVDLSLSGLASGFDWKTLVDQLAEVERAPQRLLQNEQSLLQQRNNAYTSIQTQLGILQNQVDILKDPSLFDSRLGASSDATIASTSAAAGAPLGSFTFLISQLASASRQTGAANVGAALSQTNDVSGLVLSNLGVTTAVNPGTFAVNGKQVTIATTDTLQQVFDQISTATGGTVTGSYDAATDKITLQSGAAVVLGSANDTSNFLQVAKLRNNGSGTITSATALGGLKTSGTLSTANFATAPEDGGSGAGQFKINGVLISWSASVDSLSNVLDRINSSGAGVVASYDAINDQVLLTNKTTGDVGVSMEEVTGNFLTATGLLGGTLTRGNDLEYTVNGGGTLVSRSNTITGDTSGIAGLSVTALKEGSVTISVSSDTDKIKQAITTFLDDYNKIQSLIDTQTASSTDAKGKVTAGLLANDRDASNIAAVLRATVYTQIEGLAGSLRHLDKLGIATSGDNNQLTLKDSAALEAALADNLGGVKALLTDSTNGITAKLSAFLERTIGEGGTLLTHRDSLARQISDIDTQVATMERVVQTNKLSMTARFVAMETAQAQISQQLAFLAKQTWGS
jgi:flagellar hook-associated protein 2